MRAIMEQQRRERDMLLGRSYLQRDTAYDAGELLRATPIKLLTGPRRCGKSTEALMLLRGTNFAYVNFDDAALLERWDEQAAEDALQAVYPGYEYLLLDEVQNLPGWDLWVAKMYRRGANMIVTGSNARLLSGEMATALTGRFVRMEMLPFGLHEYIRWRRTDGRCTATDEALAEDYLTGGGYPETIFSPGLAPNYLSALFDATVWKDVAQRHKVKNTAELDSIAHFLLSNICGATSASALAQDLGLASVATAKKFLGYLEEPYLFRLLPRYNVKLRLMEKAPKKIYAIDNGLVTAKAFSLSANKGNLLENQVFVELLRRGYDTEKTLFYYRSRNDRETDFVTRRGTSIERLIQVCFSLESAKALKRETDAIVECAEELGCEDLSIVTMAEERTIEKDGHTIKVVPVLKF